MKYRQIIYLAGLYLYLLFVLLIGSFLNISGDILFASLPGFIIGAILVIFGALKKKLELGITGFIITSISGGFLFILSYILFQIVGSGPISLTALVFELIIGILISAPICGIYLKKILGKAK